MIHYAIVDPGLLETFGFDPQDESHAGIKLFGLILHNPFEVSIFYICFVF